MLKIYLSACMKTYLQALGSIVVIRIQAGILLTTIIDKKKPLMMLNG
jgi:hypothetical protein